MSTVPYKIDLRITKKEFLKLEKLGKQKKLTLSETIRGVIDGYDGRHKL